MQTRTWNFASALQFKLFVALVLAAHSIVQVSHAGPTNAAPVAAMGADTPEKLISRISNCCLIGDSTNLLLCFDTSTKAQEVGAKSFAISIELAKAKAELRNALVKKFGTDKFSTLKGNYVLPVGLDPLKQISE